MPTPPLHHLFHPENADEYTARIGEGLEQLIRTLRDVRGPSTGLSPELAAKPVLDVDLDAPLEDTAAALDEVARLWMDDAVWFHEPTYAAHLNCPIVIPALVGELLLTAVNSSMDTFDQSVGGTFIERHLVDWTCGRIGYDGGDGVFTSGGSQSNLQALLMARGGAEERGIPLDRLRILASTDSHFSVQKSARLLGLGHTAVIGVPTDESRRLDVVELARALAGCVAAGEVPMAVVATAGTTDFGAIDPLGAIAGLCRTYGAWLHVDAAYGGGLLASTRRRHLLGGIEQADSVTVDFHKTFFQPVSSSAILVRDPASLRHVAWYADYLNPKDSGTPNQVDKSLQTTRRFDALKLWLTLRVMGPDLVGDYLDAAVDLTQVVHDEMCVLPDIEIAAAPGLSTLVFRYTAPHLDEAQVSRLNKRIRSALWARGTAIVAGTKVDGRQFLKLTLLNPKATPADILGIVGQVREIGRDLTGVRWAGRELIGVAG